MQNMPWSCQLTKKTMNKWCEYQKRSKLALRRFSIANHTMAHRQKTMIQPVIPGPVEKFINKKSMNVAFAVFEETMEILTKLYK